MGWISASTSSKLSSGRFQKICKLGGEFLQAHVGNLGKCPVADFTQSANWGGGNFYKAHLGNLGNCPVADFEKICKLGGNFCKPHVGNLGNCPVADFGKSAK